MVETFGLSRRPYFCVSEALACFKIAPIVNIVKCVDEFVGYRFLILVLLKSEPIGTKHHLEWLGV